MTQLLWFLTRATGIVALLLIFAAVADGLVFSGRNGGGRVRPAWWMDLHRGLGGYALIFTGAHLATAYGADIGGGLAQVLVPGAAKASTTAYALGVLALYAIAATVLTTWPKRRLRRKVWHLVHLLSIPAAVAAAMHAYQLGSDARKPLYLAVSALAAGVTTYPLALRLLGVARLRSVPADASSLTADADRELTEV